MGVVHSLINTAKITSQDWDEFNMEIKNMKHEYPQQLIESIMKPGRNNHPLHRIVEVPYVWGCFRKFPKQ
jgi:hypothetical protein